MEVVTTLRHGIRVARSEPVPLVLPVAVQRGGDMVIAGGTALVQERVEHFVNITMLPHDLQERVKTFIEAAMRA